MWLSKKIKNDPEVKETLQEIAKLIDDYSDATNIPQNESFFGRLFKPRLGVYAPIVLAALIIETLLYLLDILEMSVML